MTILPIKFFIESYPILSKISILTLTFLAFALVYYLVQPRRLQRKKFRLDLGNGILEFLSVKQRPFIPSSEIALFNLLHFVSREFFLVFAKIPIRTLVQVSVDDIDVRREVGKALRTVTADYVFVHPGTMLPKKVVMVDSADQDLEQSSSVSTVMKVICQQAEIDIVWLNANRNYSVNELSEVLGLKEDT